MADPANHGVDPGRLEDVAAYLAGIDSNCMAVIKDVFLVDSRYWNGTTPETSRTVYSAAFALGLEQQHPPGETWHYGNTAVQTLEPILKRATGPQVEDYAQATFPSTRAGKLTPVCRL